MTCVMPGCDEPATRVFTRLRDGDSLDIPTCAAHVMDAAVLQARYGATCESFRACGRAEKP